MCRVELQYFDKHSQICMIHELEKNAVLKRQKDYCHCFGKDRIRTRNLGVRNELHFLKYEGIDHIYAMCYLWEQYQILDIEANFL